MATAPSFAFVSSVVLIISVKRLKPAMPVVYCSTKLVKRRMGCKKDAVNKVAAIRSARFILFCIIRMPPHAISITFNIAVKKSKWQEKNAITR